MSPDRRLLLVHAHPDDESIGQGVTMAHYVDAGAGVTLVTCTAGEEGEILPPELAHLAADREDRLAEHRRGELAAAMAELGVTDHRFLGGFGTYRDSGMVWGEDGRAVATDRLHPRAFWAADLLEAADHLVAVVREVRPQVLVTYDEGGGYGHPDHIQAHRVATYAAVLAGAASHRPDLGEPWSIAKGYWAAMARSRRDEGLRRLREAAGSHSFEVPAPGEPLPPVVVPDEAVTAVVESAAHLPRKLAALRAHATQLSVADPFFALTNNRGMEATAAEDFRLVWGTPGPLGPDGVETDLFAGL